MKSISSKKRFEDFDPEDPNDNYVIENFLFDVFELLLRDSPYCDPYFVVLEWFNTDAELIAQYGSSYPGHFQDAMENSVPSMVLTKSSTRHHWLPYEGPGDKEYLRCTECGIRWRT